MATNKPDNRQTHITRIVGTNKNGEVLQDIWADVERMDIVKSAWQVPPDMQWQGVQRKLLWSDDPDADDYQEEGTLSRLTEIVKVCDPENEDNVDDPEEWIPIRVIKGMKSRAGDSFMDRFVNGVTDEDLRTARIVEVRRIVHYDTFGDDAAQAAFDANPARKEYVFQNEAYEKIFSTDSKDKDQYVEHEIITYLKHKGDTLAVMAEGRQTKLLNEYLLDESEEPDFSVTGRDGVNPPYRLDPFQNIVNVSFGGLAVEFPDHSYIEIPTTVPNTKKALISFWFRVPQASLDAAKAEAAAWQNGGGNISNRPLLNGIVPLVTFGPTTKVRKTGFEQVGAGSVVLTQYVWRDGRDPECGDAGWTAPFGTNSTPVFDQRTVFKDGTTDFDPSFIGIDCSGDQPALAVNIVMPSVSTATFKGSFAGPGTSPIASQDVGDYLGGGICPGAPPYYDNPYYGLQIDIVSNGPLPPFYTLVGTAGETQANVVLGAMPETFATFPKNRVGYIGSDLADRNYIGPRVTGDHWHHVLLSFDFTKPVRTRGALFNEVQDIIDAHGGPFWNVTDGGTIDPHTEGKRTTSAARMYIALDDKNLTRSQLGPYYPTGYGDPNAILSVNGFYVANDANYNVTSTSMIRFGRQQTIISNGFTLPEYSYTPAAVPFSKGKMGFPAAGEYKASKRVEMGEFQMFTDVAMNTASPSVRRAFITAEGKPAPMSKAAKLVGKKPEVMLHRSSNWKKGRNTGTLADTPPAEGVYVGKIKTYKPNPNLNGDQGKKGK